MSPAEISEVCDRLDVQDLVEMFLEVKALAVVGVGTFGA